MPDKRFFNIKGNSPLSEIAAVGGCKLSDDKYKDTEISSVAPIESAGESDITFLSNVKYAEKLKDSKARACIMHPKMVEKAPANMILLISENPYASYAKIATYLHPDDVCEPQISKNADISLTAQIGKNCTIESGAVIKDNAKIADGCFIGAGSYIGKGVEVGENTKISSNVTITHAIIGKNVLLHPGVRIGQDGFGFATDKGVHIKVPQLGRVVVEDWVEIGANSCVDRGAGPDTIIGAGTKIDNLVQIGHNVQTGKGCIIVSQVGVSGSTKLGDYVVLGGQVGVAGHLNIGSMVNVAAQSGVMNNIEPKQIVGGSPAIPVKQWHRQTIAIKKLIKKKGETNE